MQMCNSIGSQLAAPAPGPSLSSPLSSPLPSSEPSTSLYLSEDSNGIKDSIKKSTRDPLSHRIIEKRRRDRMNKCLSDLSRLIPSHYSKKGRGRIEKTEIVEMAIKHIKQLEAIQQSVAQPNDNNNNSSFIGHTSSFSSSQCNRCKQNDSGVDSSSDLMSTGKSDSNPIDSYQLGFRDCISESVRFLLQLEAQSPTDLCFRLVQHLNAYLQRTSNHFMMAASVPSTSSSSTAFNFSNRFPTAHKNSNDRSTGSASSYAFKSTSLSQENNHSPPSQSFTESWASTATSTLAAPTAQPSFPALYPHASVEKIQIKLEEMEVEESQAFVLAAARRVQQLQEAGKWNHEYTSLINSNSCSMNGSLAGSTANSSNPSPATCPSANPFFSSLPPNVATTQTHSALNLLSRPSNLLPSSVASPPSILNNTIPSLHSVSSNRNGLLLNPLATGSLGTTAPPRRLSTASLAKSRSLTSSPNSAQNVADSPALYKFKKNIKERFQADLQSALLRSSSSSSSSNSPSLNSSLPPFALSNDLSHTANSPMANNGLISNCNSSSSTSGVSSAYANDSICCDHTLPNYCTPACSSQAGLRPRSATISTELCNGRPLPPSIGRRALLTAAATAADPFVDLHSTRNNRMHSLTGTTDTLLSCSSSSLSLASTSGACSPGFLLHPTGSFYVPIEVQLSGSSSSCSSSSSSEALASSLLFRPNSRLAMDSGRILHPISIAVHFGYNAIRVPTQSIVCATP